MHLVKVRDRAHLAQVLAPMLSGYAILQFRVEILEVMGVEEDFLARRLFTTAGVGLLSLGFTYGLWRYLRGELTFPFLDSAIQSPRKTILNQNLDLESGNSTGENPEQISYSSKAINIQVLRRELTASLSTDIIAKVQTDIAEGSRQSYTRKLFKRHSDFILQEIVALTRRANVNLIIGVVTTLMAAGLLVAMIANGGGVPFSDMTKALEHYIPKVSTVIFIEVFSFFFLKLYRSNLSEIKYYENELTNLVSHEAAMELAIYSGDTQAICRIADGLASVDRNKLNVSNVQSSADLKDLAGIVERLGDVVVKIVKKGS